MSATLNFNPIKYTSWKGNVFYKRSSFLRENQNNQNLTVKLVMNHLPLKIYRKETNNDTKKCNERISVKIEHLDRPGSIIVTENFTSGLMNYKTNDVTECESKSANSCIHMPDVDARRRVRSAGMIRRKYNENRNNDTYCTSSNQYLVSRNRTFSQNQYNYIRQGNASAKPGTNSSKMNLYSAGGLSHCPQPYISVKNDNNKFSYRWINSVSYDVVIPDGEYNIYQLNNILQNVMIQNTHYFKGVANDVYYFLLYLSYDDLNKVVVLETKPYGNYLNNINYTINPTPLSNWNTVVTPVQVAFQIPNTKFQNIIGFTAGTYGAAKQTSNITPHITSNYVSMNYKPNNPQFGQQGAVSSSTLISRKRYDTITDVGAKMKAPYGSATANALAYGVTDHQYTLKDKMGYPLKRTPVISKFTGEIRCVNSNNM
jgi:hypothetical protein